MWQALVLWLLWCFLHSYLISARARTWVETRGGWRQGVYRLGYVLFSALSLLPLLWVTNSLPQQPLPPLPGWVRAIQYLLLLYAVIMFWGGWRVYDLRSFLGLRQWQDYLAGNQSVRPEFKQTGILRTVRHPWYSGGIALIWAMPGLTDVTLAIRLLLSAYLIVGTVLEERKLTILLGEPYQIYCRKVPMLFPWKLPRRSPQR